MQRHAAVVACLLAAKLGCWPAATAAVSGQQQCIRSLLPPNSTTSIRAPGSPTYWLPLPILPRRARTICCRGTGSDPAPLLGSPDHGGAEPCLYHPPRRQDA